MGFADYMRDRVLVQQAVQSSDSSGGLTTTWTTRANVQARLGQVGGGESRNYARDGFRNAIRVAVKRTIPTTQGYRRLDELINAATLTDFRLVHSATSRNLQIIAVMYPAQGLHDTQSETMFLDCIEYPEPTGWKDQ